MKLSFIIIAASVSLFSSMAVAGAAQPYIPVSVDYDTMYATGSMLAARESKNDVEYIGCYVNAYYGGTTRGGCTASDPDGNRIECSFEDVQVFTDAVYGISDYSVIGFAWDVNLNCILIRVSQRSIYLPGK